MKRKAPKHNKRRVRYIQKNHRSTFTNKAGRSIQCESFNEYKFVIALERDVTVRDYISQGIQFRYLDTKKRKKVFTVDFKVFKTDGSIEFHEVTIEERWNSKESYREREEAGHRLSAEMGCRFFLHSENMLLNESEIANFDNLIVYRPACYSDSAVTALVVQRLRYTKSLQLSALISEVSEELGLPENVVAPNIYHLLWHGLLDTDFSNFIFFHSSPKRDVHVWMKEC